MRPDHTRSAGSSIQSLLRISRPGVARLRGAPRYGSQDLGISPGGAMDRLSWQTGNLLLGNALDQDALEVILPPELAFSRAVFLVLTGAHWSASLVAPDGAATPVEHGAVAFAAAGTRLRFDKKNKGFRAYLCVRDAAQVTDRDQLLSRRRGSFQDCFSWPDPAGRMRILAGPEYDWLVNPEAFTAHYWKISHDLNDMGMRLEGEGALQVADRNMISDVVADGTIQMTPKGPIVLLRHRQTVGGYPRIFNVISADIDLLAQFGPGNMVRFRPVDHATAAAVAQIKRRETEALARRFSAG